MTFQSMDNRRTVREFCEGPVFCEAVRQIYGCLA